jgi:cell division protein FtsW
MSSRGQTDWPLFVAILLILGFGLVMVYSASSTVPKMLSMEKWDPAQSWSFMVKQFVAAILGLAGMFWLRSLDYQRFQHPLWVFLPVNLVYILLMGAAILDHKAHRWYNFGGIEFQPSELAKPVLLLFLAWFVARRESKINDRYTLLPAALIIGGFAGIICYGDLGTAMIILVPAVVIFFVAGIERKYFYGTLVLAFVLMIGFIVAKPYRMLRVLNYIGVSEETLKKTPHLGFLAQRLDYTEATRDADHQPRQSKIAVGSGGIFGVGLGQSTQKLGFLPEAHTDFIFAVIGEETGLVGCTALLAAYFFIFWRGLRLYFQTQDAFGRYLALGCVSLLTAQAFFNMSVVLHLLPTKGIPLPLISYGGSAMACTLLTFGLLLSVSERATH